MGKDDNYLQSKKFISIHNYSLEPALSAVHNPPVNISDLTNR